MRQELAALVVHDLKNALGVLEAQLCTLQQSADPLLAGRAHRQCTDMRLRFMMFLTLYGSGGEIHAHCEDESPGDFLRGLLTLVAPPEGAAPLSLGDCSLAPPFWYFDFRLVRMALESALHNAWRFARAQIVLGVREEGGWLVFRIDDDGPGLGGGGDVGASASATTAATAATGLGTELCLAVARAHGTPERPGRVSLSNRAEGGARFELWVG